MNILIVGSGARELAIARALMRSISAPTLYCFGTHTNPGIFLLCRQYRSSSSLNNSEIIKQALDWHIDLAIIGPESPLAAGIVDHFIREDIPALGPTQALARIETSKAFTRDLMQKYQISGGPRYRTFTQLIEVKDFLRELGENHYVIKADGLMGGKGVKVAGDHLHSIEEAYQFCVTLLQQNKPFVIEEKLIGQEFSFLCLTDGKTLLPMPLVQDHKRAFAQDQGPNTGGMGSYSDANHTLPFLTARDVQQAAQINHRVLEALQIECQAPYRGILYGSFIATEDGVYLIEYNARFGDPEAMNILSIVESDFAAACYAAATGQLTPQTLRFKSLATVCKYAVPEGYPDHPITKGILDISPVQNKALLYPAHIEEEAGILQIKGSRAIAVVATAPTITEAEIIAEAEISRIQGPVFHREDIAKPHLIQQRIDMMKQLRAKQTVS